MPEWRSKIRHHVQRSERERIHEYEGRPGFDLRTALDEWQDDVPGHPLGVGSPTGRTLREDGESHANAWRRLLRGDPCAYCERAYSGSVDHIQPRSLGKRYLERWTNLTGSCQACNGSKGSRSMLLWMLQRQVVEDHAARNAANAVARASAPPVGDRGITFAEWTRRRDEGIARRASGSAVA